MSVSEWTAVACIADLIEDRFCFEFDNEPYLLLKVDSDYYAIEDRCPHADLPLAEGLLEGLQITCPYHGAQFCLKTGAVLRPPAFEAIRCLDLRLTGSQIEVRAR